MSVLPPLATAIATLRTNAKGHERTFCAAANNALFDHLVGASEQLRRNGEAQRLGGLDVDDKLILRWRLHRQIARLLTSQDTAHVASSAPVEVDPIRPIREQAAGGDEGAIEVDRGELEARPKCYD